MTKEPERLFCVFNFILELRLFVTISTILLIRFAGSAGHDGQDHHGSAGHDYHGPTCHDYHGSAGQNYHGSASQNYHGAARQDHHGPTGQDHLAYLPSCVAKALPGFELARTSFQDLEFAQIWRDRITAGYLSCNFCVALVTKFQQNISKYDDIRALVKISISLT